MEPFYYLYCLFNTMHLSSHWFVAGKRVWFLLVPCVHGTIQNIKSEACCFSSYSKWIKLRPSSIWLIEFWPLKNAMFYHHGIRYIPAKRSPRQPAYQYILPPKLRDWCWRIRFSSLLGLTSSEWLIRIDLLPSCRCVVCVCMLTIFSPLRVWFYNGCGAVSFLCGSDVVPHLGRLWAKSLASILM